MEDLSAIISPDIPEPSAKDVVRHQIEQRVGDTASLLGTLSDVSGAQLAFLAIHVVCLADHASNEAQRQELAMLQELAGEEDIVALCRAFLTEIQSGEVVLTLAIKGVSNVLSEVKARSTETAKVLIESTQ